ncbi:type II secretion system protein GspE [Pseudoalteromonas aurantia]|nr:type II secretion system protein GspE [Pseudoalteromonas aurantia]
MNSFFLDELNISEVDFDRARVIQDKFGGRLDQILINMGSLSEDQVPLLLSKIFNIPLFERTLFQVNDASEKLEMLDFLIKKDAFLFGKRDNELLIAAKDPLDLELNNWLEQQTDVVMYIAKDEDIEWLRSELGVDNLGSPIQESLDEVNLKELASEAPVVNLLNSLISRALRQGASDMHLEPFDGRYRARYRVDGVLHDAEYIAAQMQLPIITRLKILSGMDIAEKRRPQDGKIEMKISNEELDIRVSALPLNDGESMVLRFLRKDNVKYNMDVLGLSKDVEESLLCDIKKTSGVVLLTGPTGSGKTTTLYTFLNALNNDDVKIITLEDPVEYQLPGINQVQINKAIGFDFAAGLRSIVRQDPDIIMLGEIRDKETAQIALQSALTGHLVFSTVHTNDAAGAYTRLLDLGVEEFLLNAALVSVVAQRLVRKVCSDCSISDSGALELIDKYNLREVADKYNLQSINLQKGAGCPSCANTGYKGRVAITEYLACDEQVRATPKDSNFIAVAKEHNAALGRRTLMQDGMYKAVLGLTTIEEVIRVAG